MIEQLAWAVTALGLGGLTWDVGRRWLQRRSVDIAAHVDERDKEWLAKFESLERETNNRITHVERNIAAAQPDFRPLGKQYNPRA